MFLAMVRMYCLQLGGGKTDSALAEIVDGVPFSEESITENGQWSYGLWEVLLKC